MDRLTRTVTLGWLLTCLGIAGCKQDSPEEPGQPPEPMPRLTTDAELTALEQQLLAMIEENRSRACRRPVLRGEAVPGKAADDIVAVVEGADDTRACRRKLEEHKDRLFEVLFLPEEDSPVGFPVRHGRSVQEKPVADASIRELVEACAPVLSRIRAAVRHEDACSPYLPGLRGQPGYIMLIRSTKAAALQGHLLLGEGKLSEAFDLLLDTLRFCQDASRGGTSLLETMVSVAAAATIPPVLEAGLNRETPLGADLLDRIGKELGQLLETQSHPSSFLRGEFQSMATYSLLPNLKDESWSPPGGWGKDTSREEVAGSPLKTVQAVHEKDGVVLGWIAMQQLRDELLSACKPDVLPRLCYEQLRELSDKAAQVEHDGWDMVKTLLKTAVSDDKKEPIRRKIIEILKSVATPAYHKYLARQGELRFTLAALRLHAAYRRLAEEQKSCPGIEAFDRPPLQALRDDPYSGKPIRVESPGEGRIVLWPPEPLGRQAGAEADPAVFIRCPFGRNAP